MKNRLGLSVAVVGAVLPFTGSRSWAADVGFAFTYQGYLEKPAGTPLTATCDLQFRLWDASSGGAEVATSPRLSTNVPVSGGVFTTSLDFGSNAMEGDARWLSVGVKCSPDTDFTALSPRQELKPAPYSLRAMNGVGPPGKIEINSNTGRGGINTVGPTQALHIGTDRRCPPRQL